MALNVVSSDRLSTNVKSSNLATGLSGKVGSSKNLIINGAMNVAQRGTTSTGTNAYETVDRFACTFTGTDETPTQAQHALTSSDTGPWAKGFRNSLHLTNGNQTGGAGAADRILVAQYIEAQNIANSGWDYTSASSKITLSFWVKSSVAQNFYGYIFSSDGTQQTYPIETGSLSADTWTKITKTIPGNSNITVDNNTGSGLSIYIIPFMGTDYTATPTLNTWAAYASGTRTPDNTSTWYTTNNSTFEITGVQLEVGDTATEFEHREYGDELQRCQRYYTLISKTSGGQDGAGGNQIGWGYCESSSTFIGGLTLPVTMRAQPSLDYVSGSSYYRFKHGSTNQNVTSLVVSGNNNFSFGFAATGMSGGTAGAAGRWKINNSSGYLAASAEL